MTLDASLESAINALSPIIKKLNGGKVTKADYVGEVLTDDIYFFLNIGDDKTANFQPIKKDILTREDSLEKESDEEVYLHDYGSKRTHYKAATLTETFTVKEYIGDSVGDYVYSKRYAVGEDLNSTCATWNSLNGKIEVFKCTVNVTQIRGGDPGSRNEIAFEIKSAGPIDISQSYVPTA